MYIRLRTTSDIYALFGPRARACAFLMHACARIRRFYTVCSPLGNARSETKTGCLKEKERERERKREKMRERRRGRKKKETKKKKKSKDRLVARIGFRTVSNDTSQDATATTRWSRESSYHRPASSFFPPR